MAESEKQTTLKTQFQEKLKEKQNDLDGLDENISIVEKYKETYIQRMNENTEEITSRAKELATSIEECVNDFKNDIQKKQEKDFAELDKYGNDSKELKKKYDKQIKYFQQVFSSLPDDDDIVEQFVKDSLPKLESMAISVKKNFPKPLKLVQKSALDIKTCFGKFDEDTFFGVDGQEKAKYRSEFDIELKFKPEPNRSSIFGIQVRPDGKAWVTTLNNRILLVLRSGQIYDECMVKFLPVYTAVNKYGHLYVSSGKSAIFRVTKNFDMSEFTDLAPYKVFGMHVTEDEHLYACLKGPESSKVVKFSEMGMLLQEIMTNQESETIFKEPKYIAVNSSGQICVSDDRRLIIVEPSGKKHVTFKPEEETWEGKSLTVDKFDNLISGECPLKIRSQNIHIMNSKGENVKTFKLEGPKINGINAIAIDYQYEEPVIWLGTAFGDVIIAKFLNTDI